MVRSKRPVAKHLTRWLSRTGEFGRDVFTVMTGTVGAQAVVILFAPVLTRLYSPSEVGGFAVIIAAVTVLGSIASGRYELAVLLPQNDSVALAVVRLCGIAALATSSGLLAVSLLLTTISLPLLSGVPVFAWLLAPFAVLLLAFSQTLAQWLIRKKRFRHLAAARLAQSLATAGASVVLGFLGLAVSGLIFGFLFGQLIALAALLIPAYRELLLSFRSAGPSLGDVSKRYKAFPQFMAPAALLEALSGQLPIVLLTAFFGPAVAGFVSLSQRTIRLPVSVVARSFGDVFRQRAAAEYAASGSCHAIFARTFQQLSLLGLPPLIALLLFAPSLFELVFGAPWRLAGEYSQLLAVMYFFQFVVNPLSFLFIIAERQRADLALQVILLLGTTSALCAGYFVWKSPNAAILLFGAIYCLKYLVELRLAYCFSRPFPTGGPAIAAAISIGQRHTPESSSDDTHC